MNGAKYMVLAALVAGCSSTSTSTSGGAAPPGGDAGTDGGSPVVDAAAGVDGSTDGGTSACTDEKKRVLGPVASVSTGVVKVTAEAGAVKTLFVDASAGGAQAAATNPRVYVSLANASAVAVSDDGAPTSSDWDLAFKRQVIFTNSGDLGAGKGASVFLAGASFDAVTAADATGKAFAKESLFDKYCQAQVDQLGAPRTSFDGWYVYNTSNNQLTPSAGVWLVRSASDKLFKLEIQSYYATAEGGEGPAGGRYRFRVAALP